MPTKRHILLTAAIISLCLFLPDESGNYGIFSPAYAADPDYTEDYIYDGKTIRIQYYDAALEDTPDNIARIRTGIRTGLIDRGLLSSWIKQELPSTSILWLEYIGSGTYKDVYLARYFHSSNLAGHTLVVGRTDYVPPLSVTEQYSKVLIPCDEFWADEALKPIARPGGVVKIVDANDEFEVYTMEFIEGLNRKQYYDKLNSQYRSFHTTNQAAIILRKESSILWMIWKATGGTGVLDLHNGNSIYTISPLAANKISRAKFFDFDYLAFSLTFEEFYRDSALALRDKIYEDLMVAGNPPSRVNILIGFYRGARLAGQTKEQIFADWDLLANAYPQDVAEAKTLVEKIRTINWIEGLSGETSSIKTYARAKIEDALFLRDLFESICIESGIIETDISKIYGAFGMAGEYTYEYFMAVKMSDGKSYFFDAGVLKEGLDPAGYNMKSVVNLRQSLHAQDPSLTGSSFGAVDTDAGIPVEARQHDKFGMNSPPAVPPEEVLDQEIIDWWAEKYPIGSTKVDFLSALEVTDIFDVSTPIATLEAMFGLPQQTLLDMILDVHTIAGTYPDIFDSSIDNVLRNYKINHFDAYTIWFKSYTLGKTSEKLSKEYNIPQSAVISLVDYVTPKVYPINTIEWRVRSEWLAYFDAIKAIPVFDPLDKYFKKLAKEIHLPYIKGNSLAPVTLKDLSNFLGLSENWTTRFRLSDPGIGKELNDLNRATSAKVMAYQKRIFPLLYGGFYAKAQVNKGLQAGRRVTTLDPYDKFEALGALAHTGADEKALIERASGLTKNEINAILIEKWQCQSGEATEYEITAQKSRNILSRFVLHLQKKGQPGVQAAYDNLVKIQSQSVYNKLSGVGTDTFTGRTAFATDRASYSTEADLIKRGVSKDAIKQYIARRLKIITGATQGFPDGCWVITDPAAIGFIDKGSGTYEAKIVDASKINKGVASADVSNFYKNDLKWKDYGIDLSVSGGAPEIEPYSFTENGISKTVQIDWFNELIPSGDRGIIKAALIDSGMLRSKLGLTGLPANSFITVEKLGEGSYKKIYRIFFGEKEGAYEAEFVFGFVFNPTIPTDIQDQFDLIANVHAEWASKVDKYLIPVPELGMVMRIIDPYDNAVKEVFTREYLPDYNRRQFRDSLLNKLGNTAEDYEYINKLLCRREAASLWMIWKATGKLVKDIGFFNLTNTLYIVSNLGLFIPKYVDFDITYSAATFKDFFTEMRREFGIGYDPELILGFYDSMKLYGMTDAQISAELDILADVNSGAVKVVKSIITEGRPITWLDNPEEDKEVPYKATQRKTIAKSLIDGDYGILNKIMHSLFPGKEEAVLIKSISGEYFYSNCIRDHYKINLNVLLGGKELTRSVLMAASNERLGAEALNTRIQFDNWKKALIERDPELGLERYGEKDLEITDHNNNVISKNIIAEEYLEGTMLSWDVFKTLPKDDPKRLALLEAQAYVYANLWKATELTPVLGQSKAVFCWRKQILFHEIVKGNYLALPINYIDIFGPFSPGQMVDFYFMSLDEYIGHPECLLRPFMKVLGRKFLIEAAQTSAYADKINTFCAGSLGPISFNNIVIPAPTFAGLIIPAKASGLAARQAGIQTRAISGFPIKDFGNDKWYKSVKYRGYNVVRRFIGQSANGPMNRATTMVMRRPMNCLPAVASA